MLGEAQKHGRSTTGVSVAFGKGDDVCTGDLTKRNQNSEKKKAVNPQSFRAKRHLVHSQTPLYPCQTHMLLEVREKLLYFGIPGILLAAPADIMGWSTLHSATLIPAIPPGDSKPFFFFSLCDFQQHVEGAVCKGRSFCHISPYPTEGQRNLSRLL